MAAEAVGAALHDFGHYEYNAAEIQRGTVRSDLSSNFIGSSRGSAVKIHNKDTKENSIISE